MFDNVIAFPGNHRQVDHHRLMICCLVNAMLAAESDGEFWKADALFVQLGRKAGRSEMLDKSKADAAIVAARICSVLARSRR